MASSITEQLRAAAINDLNELIETLSPNRKRLYIDESLYSALPQISADFATANNIECSVKLEDVNFDSVVVGRDMPEVLVFIVRPETTQVKMIAVQVRTVLAASDLRRRQFHVIFVPQRSVLAQQVLEDDGILEHVEISDLPLGFLPLETDLISLEMNDLYNQLYVENDVSALSSVSGAIQSLQANFGIIPNVKGKGTNACKVIGKVLELQREEDSSGDPGISAMRQDISSVVVIDRDVDLISPFLTPLTYESLVHRFFGINMQGSILAVDPSVVGEGDEGGASSSTAAGSVQIVMDNSDEIFKDIRDLSIEQLGAFTKDRTLKIKDSYTNFRGNKDASISEIHKFVKQIPGLTKEYKSLNHHIRIAEVVKRQSDTREFREMWQMERGILEGEGVVDTLEDLIFADTEGLNADKALCLLCLHSMTSGGIRTNKLDSIKRAMIQNYGFEYVFTLNSLERVGLVRRKDALLSVVDTSISVWHQVRKPLRLINDSINMSRPDDISYVTAGYAPLSVRLLQIFTTPGTLQQYTNDLKHLPGPMFEFTQHKNSYDDLRDAFSRLTHDSVLIHPTAATSSGAFPSLSTISSSESGQKPILLFVIIGGITRLEIAALRFLTKDPSFPYSILIGCTGIVSGASLVNSMRYDMKTSMPLDD